MNTNRRVAGFLSAGLALIVVAFALMVSAAPAVDQTQVEVAAWQHALDLAQATPNERTRWERPPVIYFHFARLLPLSPEGDCGTRPGTVCIRRICGETNFYLALDKDDPTSVHWASFTLLFTPPTEDWNLPSLLAHEYLHTVWEQRVAYDREFLRANPDSEVWVQSLIDTPCPTV